MSSVRERAKAVTPEPIKRVIRFFIHWYFFIKHVVSVRCEFCTVPLPWMKIYQGNDDVVKIHKLALVYIWNDATQPAVKWAFFLKGLIWPILCIRPIWKFLGLFGSIAHHEYGISSLRQGMRMWKAAVIYGLQPEEYYKFRSFICGDISQAKFYIQHHEQVVLLREINRDIDMELLGDKLRFFRFCVQNELPTITVYAVIRPEMDAEFTDPEVEATESLPACDLFVKPLNLCRGIGSERFLYDSATKRWRNVDRSFTQDELFTFLSTDGSGHTYLIQPCVKNHPEWGNLTSGALATVRVVTYRMHKKRPECFAARIAIPANRNCINDHDGYAVGVDVKSGLMTSMVLEFVCMPDGKPVSSLWPLQVHPDTGEDITDNKLFGWELLSDLCVKGHEKVPEMPFIGWDVTMAEEGPLIVEANSIWGHTSSQVSQQTPLGQTPYPSCYFEYMEKANIQISETTDCKRQ